MKHGHRFQEYTIHNVISTADLQQRVDVPQFLKYSWGKYDLELYGGRCGYVKDEMIDGSVTVFLSGKMISTGSKSIDGSIMQLEYTMDILNRSDFVKKIKLNPKIQNIVATVDLGTRIDLDAITLHVPDITFERDQFTGAVLRISGSIVCLLFTSGKIVITGSKSKRDIVDTVKKLKNILRPFMT